jgi:thiol-disulfide isomerase/thioredoxin
MRASRGLVVRIAAAAVAGGFATAALAGELELGAKGPDFKLLNVDGKEWTLAQAATGKDGKPADATVVVFTCNHCPFAKAYEPVLLDMAKAYASKNVAFVFINPNDPAVAPDDSYENMQQRAKEKGYPFPYLFDATQETAKAYGALVTPHVFLLDKERVLRYRGRVNDNKDQTAVKSNDLANAIDALLAGRAIETAETKAFGCSVKWRKTS